VRAQLSPVKRAIVVMGKLPCPGRVKTRLAVDLGDQLAAELYEAFLRDVLDLACAEAQLLSAEALFSCGLSPQDSLRDAQALCPPDVRALRQGQGDLGARMEGARQASQARHVVIIGSDAPTMPRERLYEAFMCLDRGADAVVGPTVDGGYDLLGLTGPGRPLFDGVQWSTEAVLRQTQAAAERAGLRLETLSLGYDLDEIDDLPQALRDAQDGRAPRTRAALQAVLSVGQS